MDLLLALDRAHASGGAAAGILSGLEADARAEVQCAATADPTVLPAGTLAARELAEGLDHPAVSGVLAAADALEDDPSR